MNYLLPGKEPAERVELLLSLTKVKSDDMQTAIIDHLSKGYSDAESCAMNAVDKSNFNRLMKKLNIIAETVEKIKEIDLNPVRK